MSLRLEMLQVARLAPKLLGESTPLVEAFFRGQQNPDGGFKDRTGQSDLYYTVFGLEGLLALQAEIAMEPVFAYLRGFGAGENLDFVHRCCLARCWAAVRDFQKSPIFQPLANGDGPSPLQSEKSEGQVSLSLAAEILRRIESFRSRDGGYHPKPGSPFGTVYGGFLALGAYQDLRGQLPEPARLAQSLNGLATPDGAWANDRGLKNGSTNATAAAVSVLRHLQSGLPDTIQTLPSRPNPLQQRMRSLCRSVPESAGNPADSSIEKSPQSPAAQWLLGRAHPQGGFLAAPQVPMPDLLSTATALHALAGLGVSLAPVQEACLDFVDSLWTNEGAFHGHWADDHLDCEYTFYGLMSLGHLSL